MKFKNTRSIKIAIFFLRIYDYIQLKLKGEKILQQDYGINGVIGNGKYYTILALIVNQSMIDDLNRHFSESIQEKIDLKINDKP